MTGILGRKDAYHPIGAYDSARLANLGLGHGAIYAGDAKQLQIGLVGHVYLKVSGDSGSGNQAGPFKSRVLGVGPRIGYIFRSGVNRDT